MMDGVSLYSGGEGVGDFFGTWHIYSMNFICKRWYMILHLKLLYYQAKTKT